MDYLFLAAVIVMNSAQYIFSSVYSRRQKDGDPYLCTLLIGATVLLFFCVYGGFSFTYDRITLIFGLLFGVAYCCGYIFQIKAMGLGSVSLTSLFNAYSLLIPTFFGIFYYHDTIKPTFIAAFVLLAAALFLVNFNPTEKMAEKSNRKQTRLWLICVLLAFLGNGCCSICSTVQQRMTGGLFRSEFMIFAMAVVLPVNAILSFLYNKKTALTLPSLKKGWWCAVILGLLNGATNLFVMVLVARNNLNLSLIYSMISAGGLLLTFLFARFIFKEKLRPTQLVGFFIGIASVVLFNI